MAFSNNKTIHHQFSVFDTLGSVALTSATEMARATLAFLQLYGWKQASNFSAQQNWHTKKAKKKIAQ